VDGTDFVKEVVLDSDSASLQSSLQTRKEIHTAEIVIRLNSEINNGPDIIHDREKPMEPKIPLSHADAPRIEDANSL